MTWFHISSLSSRKGWMAEHRVLAKHKVVLFSDNWQVSTRNLIMYSYNSYRFCGSALLMVDHELCALEVELRYKLSLFINIIELLLSFSVHFYGKWPFLDTSINKPPTHGNDNNDCLHSQNQIILCIKDAEWPPPPHPLQGGMMLVASSTHHKQGGPQ